MRSQHHYRRRTKEQIELDMTTFLNLMVVLVPFLLITAVFSRIAIIELSLPTSVGGEAPREAGIRVEVIVRGSGLEISDGRAVIARRTVPRRLHRQVQEHRGRGSDGPDGDETGARRAPATEPHDPAPTRPRPAGGAGRDRP